jgi:mono/diheme cytochrome c family protein
MSESPSASSSDPRPAGRLPRALHALLGILLAVVKRVWALLLIIIILWLSWRAFRYLLDSLVFEGPVPPQVIQLPLRTNEQMLESPATAFAGLQAVEHPRVPLGHYHRLSSWFQPDYANDCTRSGCHSPLPHGRSRVTRAFLNMHATTLHCGVCHIETAERPLDLVWYNLKSGAPSQPPALLRIYGLLVKEPPEPPPATDKFQHELVEMLDEAGRAAGGLEPLNTLARHLAAVRPGSDEWWQLINLTRERLPRFFRGDYGVKLALWDPQTGRPVLGFTGDENAVAAYLSQGKALAEEDSQALLARIHQRERRPTLQCQDCHRPEGGLIDPLAVGYPPARARQMAQPLVVRMIEDILRGEPFRMPSFLTPSTQERPASSQTGGQQ